MNLLRFATRHQVLLSMFAILAATLALQFSVPWFVGGDDGIRHIMYANLWRTEGYRAVADYSFLPYSLLHLYPTDPWFGFHALLVPFSQFGTLLGLKIWNCLVAVLFALASWWLFRTYRVRHAAFFVFLLSLGSSIFFFRMNLGRPFALGHVILLLALIAIHKRSYVALIALGILFTFLHQIFPIYFVWIAIAGLAHVLARNETSPRFLYRDALVMTGMAGLGILIGLALHPHPLNYLRATALISTILGASSHVFLTGQELQPISLADYIANFGVILPFWLLAVVFTLRSSRTALVPFQFSLYSIIFFVACFYSQRFLDYFWITCIITLAITWTFALEHNDQIAGLWQRIREFSHTPLIIAGIVAIIASCTFFGSEQWALANNRAMQPWKDAAVEVTKHTGTDEVIFNASWDSFPFLFYFNPHARYVAAFDPLFLYAGSHERYFKWWHVAMGDALVCGREHCNSGATIEDTVKNEFKSRTIVLENKKHAYLKEYLDVHTIVATKDFDDGLVSVYELR